MTYYLYTPAGGLGGTETLAARIARALLEENLGVVVVTAPGGWLANECIAFGCPTLSSEDFGRLRLGNGDSVIASAKYIPDDALHDKVEHAMWWILHPLEYQWILFKRIYRLYAYMPIWWVGTLCFVCAPFSFHNLRRLFKRLVSSNRIIAMSDDCNQSIQKFFKIRQSAQVLALPSIGGELLNIDHVPRAITAIRKIGYFGRIEDFKLPAIKRLIEAVVALNSRDRTGAHGVDLTSVTLFGYGAGESEVTRFSVEHGCSVEITGALPLQAVSARAASEHYLMFVMGLSGLDLLASGIPCVFVPIAKSVSDDSGGYRYFSQLPAGSVGTYSEFLRQGRNLTFEEVMLDVESGQLDRHHQSSIDRLRSVHEVKGIIERLSYEIGVAQRLKIAIHE